MLPQANRLRKEKEVNRVFKTGKSVFDPVCGFKGLKNNLGVSRFAVMVGVKISKSSVVRNRIRRRIREIIRLNLPNIKPGYDLSLIVRPEAKTASYQELEQAIIGGFRKVGLMR
jgi:ribonuclease P protein component